MFILKELYVVSQKKKKEKKKRTLCMESYACDTEWVQSSNHHPFESKRGDPCLWPGCYSRWNGWI